MKHFLPINLHSLLASLQKQGVLVVFLLLVCSIQANATHIWTGAVNNDWSNAGNWNPASVPSSSDFVKIPNLSIDPEIKPGYAASISGILIELGATLKIQITGQLGIDNSSGNAMVNKGTLDNFGYLLVGNLSQIPGTGILNNGLLSNRQSGQILIDHCVGSGLASIDGDV